MSKRFGRRREDGIFEYSDDDESLKESARREISDNRAEVLAPIGLLVGGVLTYTALRDFGVEWPKWVRFGLVVAGSVGLACVLSMVADFIWRAFQFVFVLAILFGIGALLWRVV